MMNQEETNAERWARIDSLEAETVTPKKKKRRSMKFWKIFGDTTGQIVLIVCGSILGACALGVGVFFVIKTVKGKGGKENEENN